MHENIVFDLMIHKRQLSILHQLVTSKKKYVKGIEISQAAGLSLKTVKKEIELLNEDLEGLNLGIIATPGEGYRLIGEDSDILQKFCRKIISSYKSGKYFQSAQHVRVHYIIRRLLLSSYLYLDDLADECFVSKSIINKDMKLVKEELDKYNLSTVNRTNKGLLLSGNEWNKRVCLIEQHRVYLNYLGVENSKYDIEFEEMFSLKNNDYYSIDELFFNAFKTSVYAIPRNCYKKALLMIILCINRKEYSNEINLNDDLSKTLNESSCHKTVADMVISINELGYDLRQSDIQLLTVYLICLTTFPLEEINNYQIQSRVDEVVDELLQYINDIIPISDIVDLELHENLRFQVFNTYCRYKYRVFYSDEINESISDYGLLSLDFSQLVNNYLIEKHKMNTYFIQETIQFYYAFSDFINRRFFLQENLRYKRVYILNKSGFYSSKLLVNKMLNYIKSNKYDFIPVNYLELFTMKFTSSDILLTDFFDRKIDILDITKVKISFFWGDKRMETVARILLKNKYIDITELFTPESFHKTDQIVDSESAYKYIEQNILHSFSKKESIIEEIKKRELYFSSTKVNRVVVLRSIHDYMNESHFHAIVPHETFLWNEKPCSLILFYNVKDNQFDAHYYLNKVISNIIHNKNLFDYFEPEEINYEYFIEQVYY